MLIFGKKKKNQFFDIIKSEQEKSHLQNGGGVGDPFLHQKKKFKIKLMKKFSTLKSYYFFLHFRFLHGARVMMVLPELRQRCHKSQTG